MCVFVLWVLYFKMLWKYQYMSLEGQHADIFHITCHWIWMKVSKHSSYWKVHLSFYPQSVFCICFLNSNGKSFPFFNIYSNYTTTSAKCIVYFNFKITLKGLWEIHLNASCTFPFRIRDIKWFWNHNLFVFLLGLKQFDTL